jgi:hypothetical protein
MPQIKTKKKWDLRILRGKTHVLVFEKWCGKDGALGAQPHTQIKKSDEV